MFYKKDCVDRFFGWEGWIDPSLCNLCLGCCSVVFLPVQFLTNRGRCSTLFTSKNKTWTRVFLEHRWSDESRLDVVCSVEDAGIQSSTTCQVSDCSKGGRGVTAYTAVSWSVWFPLRWKNKLKQYSDQLWRQIKHTVFKRTISFTGLEIYCLHPGSIVFVKCKGMKKTFAVITVLKFLK